MELQQRKNEMIRRVKSASNWITAGGHDMIRAIEKADGHETLDIIDRSRDWKSLHFSSNK